uniref:C2H2-type domain-containing protein n=1 Tax=Stomoxys calcitrans TaxID=35570 RepID=A0A1I8PDJ8_STOCA
MFEFCCLCIKICTDHRKLNDENGHPNDVYELAVKYFSPVLLKLKNRTQVSVVCAKCWSHISDFHTFQEAVFEAQRKLSAVNKRSETVAKAPPDGSDLNLENVQVKIEQEAEEHSDTAGGMMAPNTSQNYDNNDIESLMDHHLIVRSDYFHNNIAEFVTIKNEPMDSPPDCGSEAMVVATCHDVDKESKKFDELIEYLGGDVDVKPNIEADLIESGLQTQDHDYCDQEPCLQDVVKLENESLQYELEFLALEPEVLGTNDNNSSCSKVVSTNDSESDSDANTEPKTQTEVDENQETRTGLTLKRSLKRPQTIEEFDTFIAKWRPELECLLCHDISPTFSLLQQHFKEHHPSEKCFIECCEKKFNYRYEIEEHVLYHKEPRIYKCEVCYKCFTVKTSLKEHLLKTHSGRRKADPFRCPTCGKAHLCKTTLRHHMKFFCGSANRRKDGKYVCTECGKSYLGPKGLRRHINFKHLERKSFKCTICDKAFIDQVDLREHMDSHTGEKSLTCAFCPRKFQYRTVLYHHCLREHRAEYEAKKIERKAQIAELKKPLTCAFCNKVYAKASSLNTHERSKHYEEYQKRKESGVLKCRILSRPS